MALLLSFQDFEELLFILHAKLCINNYGGVIYYLGEQKGFSHGTALIESIVEKPPPERSVKLAGQLDKRKLFENEIKRLNFLNIYMRGTPRNIKNISQKWESQSNVSSCPANITPVTCPLSMGNTEIRKHTAN